MVALSVSSVQDVRVRSALPFAVTNDEEQIEESAPETS